MAPSLLRLRWTDETPALVPMRLTGPRGWLVVQAVLDSGAGSCFLHPRHIATLGLPVLGPALLRGAAGNVRTTLHRADALVLGKNLGPLEMVALGPACAMDALFGRAALRFFQVEFFGLSQEVTIR